VINEEGDASVEMAPGQFLLLAVQFDSRLPPCDSSYSHSLSPYLAVIEELFIIHWMIFIMNELTPWNGVLHKLIVAQMTFYRTQNYVTCWQEPKTAPCSQSPIFSLFKTHLNIILQAMSKSPKWGLQFRFSNQSSVCPSLLRLLHALSISGDFVILLCNSWWKYKLGDASLLKFPSVSCLFFLLVWNILLGNLIFAVKLGFL